MNAAPSETSGKPCPGHAQVVVIGGGVIGCSVAYHLTKLGRRDVLLLERGSIGGGTSWHSLGVVGLLRAGPTLTSLAMETARLLPELERETGKSTGYSVRGSVNLAASPERMHQFRRVADVGRSVGLEVREIDAAEAKRLWPLMSSEGLVGAIHLPSEGQCNPLDLTQAYLAGARMGGVTVREQVTVTDLELRNGRVAALETSAGRIECEQVVNCTGIWARDFGRDRGAQLPLQAVEHNYLVTEPMAGLPAELPIMRDPDITLSVRGDGSQLSIGFNERVAKLFATAGVPEDVCFEQLPPDWDSAMPYLEQAMTRVPALREVGIRLFLCGPESVTPDTRYLLGPLPGIDNYFVAAGFSGMGIGSSGGAGRALAEWMVEGRAPGDLWDVDIRRMMPFQSNKGYLEQRAVESQGRLFAINWPHFQHETARGVRRSPLHESLRSANASFACVAGWEVADWFAPEGAAPRHGYSFGRPDWFPQARDEARTAMEAVGLVDRSHIGKFLVVGVGAEAALSGLCANDPAIAVGGRILTPLLDERGGIQALMTVIRRAEDEFLLLSESATQRHDLDLLRRRLASAPQASVVDVTSGFAAVEIIGPAAGETLAQATGRPCEAVARATEIGCAPVLLLPDERLAWPAWLAITASEFAVGLFDSLREAGSKLGVGLVGRQAHHFIRTGSRCPIWPQAITSEDTPAEAGLDALVDVTAGRAFVGRDAHVRQVAEGVRRRLAALVLEDPDAVLLGHEPILQNGEAVGAVQQTAYALDSTAAVGLGYVACGPGVDAGDLADEEFRILVAGRPLRARLDGLVAHGGPRPVVEAALLAVES